MAQSVAELLVQRLSEWGVDTIFGFAGDGIGEILEVLRRQPERMRFVQVRHEEAAAFAACSYAKYTGRLGVCMATSGPGGIHLRCAAAESVVSRPRAGVQTRRCHALCRVSHAMPEGYGGKPWHLYRQQCNTTSDRASTAIQWP